jgi:hypothetical protein
MMANREMSLNLPGMLAGEFRPRVLIRRRAALDKRRAAITICALRGTSGLAGRGAGGQHGQ